MKKRFTLITAALMLLVFLTPPCLLTAENQQVMKNIGFEENVLALPDRGGEPMRETASLTNANIVAAGDPSGSYASYAISDGNSNTWNVYAIKNYHSKATNDKYYLQIKKYASSTAYYIQVPTFGTKITALTMTVSGSSQPMSGGGNSATLYFSASNSTSSAGSGVASGTGASSVTIDCSSLDLNTGYITAGAAVRIWDVTVTYTSGGGSTYSVTYKPNTGEGDDFVDNNSGTGYTSGATVTVLTNTSVGITKTGHDFSKWNTSADGSGTDRMAGSTFAITGNTTLFAQWTAHTHDVTMPSADTKGSYTASATDDVPYGTEVTLTYTPNVGYESYEATWSINGTPIAGNTFNMPDENVTVTVTVTLSQWVLTDLANLTPADVFVIVGTNATASYAMSNDKGASYAPDAIVVTITGDKITSTVLEKIQWNICISPSGEYVFYPKGSATTWLYLTGSDAKCKVGTGANKTFVYDNTYNYLKNIGTEKYIGVYNDTDWRGYVLSSSSIHANIAGQTFAFFKKVTENVTINKDITGYGSGTGKWYLIAPPVASVASTSVATGDYDLYYFDQSQAQEWRNYKSNAFANLKSGKGYLYAHSDDIELNFTGQPYRGNGVVTLTKTDDVDFSGWNLVGNPFNASATIPLDYYRMNGEGTGVIPTDKSNAINAMEGVFVQAATNGATLTFTPSAKGNAKSTNQLVVNVSKDNSDVAIDRAIVRFGESNTLPKLRLLEGGAEIYIPKNGKDYAIAFSEGQGELPVNFKVAENGTYTLSFEVENTEMNYLHLIDKLTGNDIDLLATPEYTFSAKSGDSENRFRLVFEANGNALVTSNEPFAYFNGSEWVIENDGNATLQVIDVMGRMLRSENVSGNATTSLPNLSAGVYVLRLVNSESIRTQKVVIE